MLVPVSLLEADVFQLQFPKASFASLLRFAFFLGLQHGIARSAGFRSAGFRSVVTWRLPAARGTQPWGGTPLVGRDRMGIGRGVIGDQGASRSEQATDAPMIAVGSLPAATGGRIGVELALLAHRASAAESYEEHHCGGVIESFAHDESPTVDRWIIFCGFYRSRRLYALGRLCGLG